MDEYYENQARCDAPEQRAQALLMNLQLFADGDIDMARIADLSDPAHPKYIFALAEDVSDDSEDAEESEDDTDQDDDEQMDSVFIPRLAVTDQNLPHATIGEVVVKDLDGDLYTVTVDKDGTVTEAQFTIDTDNIADGSITAAKIEENSITSRELDLEQIFADSALLNEMLAANIDAAGLFENQDFLDRLRALTVNKAGDAMTGALVLPADPVQALEAVTKQYVDAADAALEQALEDQGVRIQQQLDEHSERMDGFATIEQLQAAQQSADGKVSKAGDTMTGALTLAGIPGAALHAVPRQYVDASIQQAIQNTWAASY